MPAIYQGDKKIVDRYIGETLITRAYQGNKLIFDAYSELSGTLPLTVRSRASQILKNYIIYGTASGAGVETENLFDENITEGIEYNYYIDKTTGNKVSNQFYYISAPISVTGGETYCWVFRISPGETHSAPTVGFFDANDNQIGVASHRGSVKYFSFTTPVNCAYVRASVFIFDTKKSMLVPGPTAPSSYIPYGYKLPLKVTADGTTTDYPIYIGDSQLMAEEYVDYESGKVYKRTENLWNPQNTDASRGYHIGYLYSDGRTENLGAWRITEYIEVEPNTNYTLMWTSNPSPSATVPAIVEYSVDKVYLRGTAYSAHNIITITTHSDTRYVRFSATATSWSNNVPRFNKGTSVVDLPYLQPTDPPVPLPDITLPQGIATIDTEEEFKNHSAIKGRIKGRINPVHYAYRINPDTAEITYLADNKNFTPAAMGSTTFDYGSWENAFFMPRPCMLKSNGKVDYYLNPNDYSKKLDGTASDIADPTYDGNVMLEFPKIYYKFVPTGDDGAGGTFHCSNVKIDDSYECWCNYDANNNEIDHFYVAAYNAVILDSKMRSLSGYALTQENGADTTTGETEIAAARANNQNGIDEWYTYLISDHQLLTCLATLMCKHVNHQAKFGRGLDTGSATAKRAYVTGTLNDKGLFWGDISTGTQGVKIFGIENFYGCVWKRAAGLIGTSTGYSYKLTHGTKDGSTATSFNTTGSGYKTIARTKPANGNVTTMHYEANGFWIPATTGTNRYAVYHWTGNGYVLVGGSSGSGSSCGSWCVHLGIGVGYSDWSISSALSCKPKA